MPNRAVAAWRNPALFLTLVIAGTLTGGGAASFPAIPQSVDAALAEELTLTCPAWLGSRVHGGGPSSQALEPERQQEIQRQYTERLAVEEAAATRSLGPATRSVYGLGVGLVFHPNSPSEEDPDTHVNLLYRDDFADHVDVVAGPSGTGLWLPASLAEQHSLTVGDDVTALPLYPLGEDEIVPPTYPYTLPEPVPYRVAAIYADLTAIADSPYWCAVPSLLSQSVFTEVETEVPIDPTLPFVLLDEELLASAGHLFNNATPTGSRNAAIDRPLVHTDFTAEEAQAVVDEVFEMWVAMSEPLVLPDFPHTYWPSPEERAASYASGLAQALAAAEQRAGQPQQPVLVTAAAGLAAGLLVAVLAGVRWARRRHDDLRSGGQHWHDIARRATGEAVGPLVVGVAAGAVLAVPVLGLLVSHTEVAVARILAAAGLAVLLSLGVVVAAATVRARRLLLDDEFR